MQENSESAFTVLFFGPHCLTRANANESLSTKRNGGEPGGEKEVSAVH